MRSDNAAIDEHQEPDVVSATDAYVESLRERILFGLSIYPFLSPTMLQVFLGTSTPASIWKEQVLVELIEEGEVVQESIQLTSPAARLQTYTILRLASNVYTPLEATSTATSSPHTDDSVPEDSAPA